MYLQHFGLSQAPFSATPNTHFLLELNSSRTLFKELILALNTPDGFVKVTGQAGVGKTTVCRKVLRALYSHSNRYAVIEIPYPRVDESGFYAAIAHELQISEKRGPELKSNVIAELNRLVESGKRVTLIIDEGQSIPDATLEALLELSKLNHGNQMLIQALIFAQSAFDDTLNSHRQKMLKERMTSSHVISPIDDADIPQYVAMRLHRSGYSGEQLFSPKALQLMCSASGGIPRLINLLAHKAMMVAFASGARTVDATHVSRAVADTAAAEQPASKTKQGWLARIRG